MAPSIRSSQVLAWRLRQQLLEPRGRFAPEEVIRRLCGVQAQLASAAELAVRVRQRRSRTGDVGRALADGRLIKTWAMRGTLHLLTPKDGGDFLSLIAAARPWARPSWQRYFGVTPEQIDALGEAVQEALDGPALTREELIAAVTGRKGLAHVGEALRSGWGTLLKPLAWQGLLCFGPNQGTRVTFTRPEAASAGWAGVPPADDAAPRAIAAYLTAYGPATAETFGNWLGGGWFGKRRLRAWFAELGERLVELDVEGEKGFCLAEHEEELAAAEPTKSVLLLPAFDQYVLGPGTANEHIVHRARRAAVSRQAGWISPVLLAGGVVCGTWRLDGERLSVEWFGEMGRMPKKGIVQEAERLCELLGMKLRLQTNRV